MQHVFICGAKSIGRYGGYETFVDMLAVHFEQYEDVQLHILCKANGEGCMDERTLPGAVSTGSNTFSYHGAHCIKLPVPNLGPASAIWYDVQAVSTCLQYCAQNHIEAPVLYILTCRIGPFIGGLKRRLKKLGGQLQLNPDGHEWMRQKWSAPVRRYWKLSEKQMVHAADLVICDSLRIEEYIQAEYAAFHPSTTYISYGADITPSPLAQDDPAFQGWLAQHGLTAGEYYLVVCRLVPENNVETILREFMHSSTRRKLAVIATPNSKLYAQLDEKLHFSSDERICFTGVVYDAPLLKKIRENAYAYFHGHQVGGTNPSLLEGLGATPLNLLLDVGFNREVALDAALYWTKEPGDLSALIARADALPAAERSRLGAMAKERIRTHYSWPYIAGQYHALWAPKEQPHD